MLNRLEMLRIVCTAAEVQHFKNAATRLGVSPQAVTRAVRDMEQLLGEPLFHRNTRHVQLTTFGETFARQARDRVSELDALFGKARQPAEAVSGVVRVAAPVVIGRMLVVPTLLEVMKKHPGIRIDLRLSDQRDDVVESRIDVGVRNGMLGDNRFVCRRVRPVNFHIVARPAVVRKFGTPRTPEDLKRLPVTALLDRNTGRPWPWFLAGGASFMPEAPVLLCDDGSAELAAILGGTGFGQLPDYMAAKYLRNGTFRRVMRDLEPSPWTLFVYRPQRGPVAPRVRLVFDALVAALD